MRGPSTARFRGLRDGHVDGPTRPVDGRATLGRIDPDVPAHRIRDVPSAAALHFGALFSGFAHGAAAAAESVIASVLLGGLLATWIRPRTVRGIALTVQGFALIGTFVGLFTIAIGIGPRTVPDLVIHAIMVIELVWGVVVAGRARAGPAGASS